MIIEMFRNGLINKWRILLSYYKIIGLSEAELVLILIVMNCSNSDKKLITPNEIAQYSNYTTKQIDQIFSNLQSRNFIQINVSNDKLEMDLTPLFSQIANCIERSEIVNKDLIPSNSLIEQINSILDSKMTTQEINELNSILNDEVLKKQAIKVINSITELISFSDFIRLIKIKQSPNKPHTLTKFNWLND